MVFVLWKVLLTFWWGCPLFFLGYQWDHLSFRLSDLPFSLQWSGIPGIAPFPVGDSFWFENGKAFSGQTLHSSLATLCSHVWQISELCGHLHFHSPVLIFPVPLCLLCCVHRFSLLRYLDDLFLAGSSDGSDPVSQGPKDCSDSSWVWMVYLNLRKGLLELRMEWGGIFRPFPRFC